MKFASLSYYEDEALTRKLDKGNIVLGRNVDLFETRTKHVWLYNVGNTAMVKMRVVVHDERLNVDMSRFPKRTVTPTSAEEMYYLNPQQKGLIVLSCTLETEDDLKCDFEIEGIHVGK